MQKGGRIKFDGSKWVADAKYRHFASEKEAEALNLLGFEPKKTGLTSMNSDMYKRITSNNRNYNSTLHKLYNKLKPEKKKKVIKCLQEASEKRIEENIKFTEKTKRPNDNGHLSYPEFIKNALKQIEFGPNTLISPSRRQSQNYPPIVVRQQDYIQNYSQNYSRTDKRRRQLTYSKEIAGNKFKKTKRRKKREKRK